MLDVFAEVKQGPPGMHCQMEALLYLRVTNIGRQAGRQWLQSPALSPQLGVIGDLIKYRHVQIRAIQ